MSRFRNSVRNMASLVLSREEFEEPVGEDAEVAAAETDAEIERDQADLDTASDTLEDMVNDQETLQNVGDIVDNSIESGEGLSEPAAAVIQETIESIYRRHGMPRRSWPKMPSTEAFGKKVNKANRVNASRILRKQIDISIEGFIDAIKKIWKQICDFIKKIWNKLFGKKETTVKKIDETINKIKKDKQEEIHLDPEENPEILGTLAEARATLDTLVSDQDKVPDDILEYALEDNSSIDEAFDIYEELMSSNEEVISEVENIARQDTPEAQEETVQAVNEKPNIMEILKLRAKRAQEKKQIDEDVAKYKKVFNDALTKNKEASAKKDKLLAQLEKMKKFLDKNANKGDKDVEKIAKISEKLKTANANNLAQVIKDNQVEATRIYNSVLNFANALVNTYEWYISKGVIENENDLKEYKKAKGAKEYVNEFKDAKFESSNSRTTFRRRRRFS